MFSFIPSDLKQVNGVMQQLRLLPRDGMKMKAGELTRALDCVLIMCVCVYLVKVSSSRMRLLSRSLRVVALLVPTRC